MNRTRRVAAKVIQVPIDEDLLRQIDDAAGKLAESRAAYIRGACRRRLEREAVTALDRRYVEGYRTKPEERAWGVLGAKVLARRLEKDRW